MVLQSCWEAWAVEPSLMWEGAADYLNLVEGLEAEVQSKGALEVQVTCPCWEAVRVDQVVSEATYQQVGLVAS